jgi:hypothetical protein
VVYSRTPEVSNLSLFWEIDMSQNKSFLRGSNIPIITILAICALVIGIGAVGRKGASGLSAQGKVTQIRNKTRALEVTQTNSVMLKNDREDGVELSLKNGYDKTITAFAISVNGLITEADLVYSEVEEQSGIAPKGVHTTRFSSARSGNPAIAAKEKLVIIVLAVIFDDKSSDGDPTPVTAMLNMRQKSKVELTRIVDEFDKALNSEEVIESSIIDKLKSRISSLPTESSGEKEDTLRRLNLPDGLSPLAKIRRLKETYKNLAARL